VQDSKPLQIRHLLLRVSGSPGAATWTTPAGTFDEPGRYRVLCNTRHTLRSFGMYGWVIVT
jgi:hypothetical protein